MIVSDNFTYGPHVEEKANDLLYPNIILSNNLNNKIKKKIEKSWNVGLELLHIEEIDTNE